ncbi:hypothetical protein PoB_004212700 [Plakobranchus ocellatus]|uniref:Uncharacterized protein n=1 Tax=Plakobranchus ocellatus TaxID=259542 RepID=A0AAV4B7Z9_9GAST|nr:hypothetical protein PoB_004212700 [Plakobranchus ocellatus]
MNGSRLIVFSACQMFCDNSIQHCYIVDWKYCDKLKQVHKEWTCGCSSRQAHENVLVYRFFWNIGRVLADYHEETVTVFCGTKTEDKATVEVVTFTRFPQVEKGRLFLCKGSRGYLRWTFAPQSTTVKARFQVHAIEWFHVIKDRARLIARLVFHQDNVFLYRNVFNKSCMSQNSYNKTAYDKQPSHQQGQIDKRSG